MVLDWVVELLAWYIGSRNIWHLIWPLHARPAKYVGFTHIGAAIADATAITTRCREALSNVNIAHWIELL